MPLHHNNNLSLCSKQSSLCLAKIYKNTSKKCKFNFIVAYVSSKSNRFYVKNILKAEIVVSTRQVLYLRMEEYKVSFYMVCAVTVLLKGFGAV